MKAFLLILSITAVTLVIASCAVGAVNPSGLCRTDWNEAQIIRNHCRLRLIQPEWVSSNGGILMNWMVAETKGRLVVIAIFGLGAVIYTIGLEVQGNENADAK